MPGSPRYVDDDATVQLDRLVVEHHRTLAIDDVIEFVGPLVVMKLGVVDLDVVDLRRGSIFFLDQRSDLPAGLLPGVTSDGSRCRNFEVAFMAVSCSARGPLHPRFTFEALSGVSGTHAEIKVRAAVSIGNEEQPPSVGVPGGMIITGGVRRDVVRVRSVGIHDVDLVIPVAIARESDPLAIGRPGGRTSSPGASVSRSTSDPSAFIT